MLGFLKSLFNFKKKELLADPSPSQLPATMKAFLEESNNNSKLILEKSLIILEQYGINLDPKPDSTLKLQNRQAVGLIQRQGLEHVLLLLKEVHLLVKTNLDLTSYAIKAAITYREDAKTRGAEELKRSERFLDGIDNKRIFFETAEIACKQILEDVCPS